MNFHEFTNGGKEVLILKRIPKNRVTNGGGQGKDVAWPIVGGKVECDQWNSEPKCGGGIHGWPWGFGLGDGMEYDVAGDVWLVIGADPVDVVGNVDNGAKCKVRTAIVRFEGTFTDAMKFVAGGFRSCVEAWTNTHVADGSSGDAAKIGSSGYSAQIGSSGNYAKIGSSGNYAKIGSSGDAAQIGSSGYSAQIGSSGNYAKIGSSGNYAKIGSSGDAAKIGSSGDAAQIGSSGDAAKIGSSGDAAQIGSSGYYAQIGSSGYSAQIGSSGDSAQIGSSGDSAKIGSSGDSAKIGSSGNYAKIGSSGDAAKITASGKDSIVAVAAQDCRVRMGERGAFAIPYWSEETGWEFITGKVGRDGILANTWYKVENGKLVVDEELVAAKS